jgi:hypothetical protein
MHLNETLVPQLNACIRPMSAIHFEVNFEYLMYSVPSWSNVTLSALTGKYIKKQPDNPGKRYVHQHTK